MIACSEISVEHLAEDFVAQADRAGQIRAGAVGRVGERRHHDRVAELQRDRLRGGARHQRVAAVDVLRSALLGAAGVDDRRRLAGGERRLHFRPRHHLELDERCLRAAAACLRGRLRGGLAAGACANAVAADSASTGIVNIKRRMTVLLDRSVGPSERVAMMRPKRAGARVINCRQDAPTSSAPRAAPWPARCSDRARPPSRAPRSRRPCRLWRS